MADNLDLRTSTNRAKVNFDCGIFDVRHPGEMTFTESGKLVGLGKQLVELAPNLDDPEALAATEKTMQGMMKIVLVGITAKALKTLRPGDMSAVMEFFNALRPSRSDEPDQSGKPSSSSLGASDSSEASEAA